LKRARRHLSADSGQQTALRRLLAERSEDTLTGQFCKKLQQRRVVMKFLTVAKQAPEDEKDYYKE